MLKFFAGEFNYSNIAAQILSLLFKHFTTSVYTQNQAFFLCLLFKVSISSLHYVVFVSFLLVFVQWSMLQPSSAFSNDVIAFARKVPLEKRISHLVMLCVMLCYMHITK